MWVTEINAVFAVLSWAFLNEADISLRIESAEWVESKMWMWKSLSCVHLCNPMGCSPSGSSVHGILQAEILEWVATPSSRGTSQPRDQTQVSSIAGRFFTVWATREAGRTQWIPASGCPALIPAKATAVLSTFAFARLVQMAAQWERQVLS